MAIVESILQLRTLNWSAQKIALHLVVPKILDLPPFQPTAARDMTPAAVSLLKQTVG